MRNSLLISLLVVVFLVALLSMVRFNEHPGQPLLQEAMLVPKEEPLVWKVPDTSELSTDAAGQLIRYGRALIENTAYYLGTKGVVKTVSNGLNCQNCHLNAGTKTWGNNFGAVASLYPKFRGRSGTVESIVIKAVEKMKENFGTKTEDLICAIGPAATVKNYEIGQDVIDAFGRNFPDSEHLFEPTRTGHARIDLHLANKEQLISVGVNPENIDIAPFCTMERTDLFFSYRVEKKLYGKTGRLLSVIGRK